MLKCVHEMNDYRKLVILVLFLGSAVSVVCLSLLEMTEGEKFYLGDGEQRPDKNRTKFYQM